MENIAIKTILGQTVLTQSAWLRGMAFLIVNSIMHQKKEYQFLTKETFDDTEKQKVPQLLNQYGNSILCLVYSYLHNMSDVEDIL